MDVERELGSYKNPRMLKDQHVWNDLMTITKKRDNQEQEMMKLSGLTEILKDSLRESKNTWWKEWKKTKVMKFKREESEKVCEDGVAKPKAVYTHTVWIKVYLRKQGYVRTVHV